MDQGQSSQATGTRDATYDIVAVLYHALQGAENCQTYCNDASGDQQLRGFFEQALNSQRQLADQAKMLLHERLMKEGGQGGGSAFSFGEGGSGSGSISGQSSGGSDQFGSQNDAPPGIGGSGQMRGDPSASQSNDPSSGQSAYGQGQRPGEMTTGGGGTSTF